MNNQNVWAEWYEEVAAWNPLPQSDVCIGALVALSISVRGTDKLGRKLARIIDMANAAAIRYGINLEAECLAWRNEVRDRTPKETK